jgi:Domain of unknown function (DUF3786)
MPGLTDRAAENSPPVASPGAASRTWEAAIVAQADRLRADLRQRTLAEMAQAIGARRQGDVLDFSYWGSQVTIEAPILEPRWAESGLACSPFDTAMLLYYLRASDGTPTSGTWVSFRELPNASLYHQAFTGYTGNRLAAAFGPVPALLDRAARGIGAEPVAGLAPHAWRFLVLPRVPLAACLWPGDEEVPPQAAILFDSNAGRHLPTDGLALLGAGLTGRLIRESARTPA